MSLDPRTTVAMFNERLRQASGSEFVIDVSGPSLSYAQVAGAADALGQSLDRLGLGVGDVVGLYMSNRADWVVGSLGCWSRGLSVAAVNRLTPAESALHELRVARARAICTAQGDDPFDAVTIPILPVAVGRDIGAPPAKLDEPGHKTDAVLVFTSGTTGTPKALVSSHTRLIEAARQQGESYASSPDFRASVAPETVAPIVSFTAFGHQAGYNSLAFSLWTGHRLALVEKFSVVAAKELIERYQLSALRLNPAAILMLATTEMDVDMSRLRYVYSGTAPLSAKTKDLFTQRYGIPILQGYGQSETGPIALSRYDDVVNGREPPGSVGRVLNEATVRVADPDDRLLPAGCEGEIQVRTKQTAEKKRSNLSMTEDGYIRTGDIGRVDPDGFMWVTGRLTDKIVVGGFNLFPLEVEDVLRRSDLVRDAVVVGLPDDRLGERPVAGVVWNGPPDREKLVKFARSKLASYKVPREWFDLDEVPLTARGKVDRREALSTAQSLLADS